MLRPVLFISFLSIFAAANAQHLRWRPADDQGSYRCIYGEIDVVSTAPTTYFCGCNWWPSAPAGGYTGIQDVDGRKHLMIFSVWDTAADLHSAPVERGDARAQLSRFGGEGEGGKTLLPYSWQLNRTYRFFIVKRQDEVNNRTLASAYFYDDFQDRWVYDATIASPNNGDKAVKGFGGDMNAFLENWSGADKNAPRLALYRLWVGTTPDDLVKVTDATGNGTWGTYGNSYFLASGNPQPLLNFINSGDKPSAWGTTDHLGVPDEKLSPDLLGALKSLFAGN
jgi:Domain of unknown function (DUF3472)